MKKKRTLSILTDENFQKEVLESPEPVMVQIGADWSGACHLIAPIIEKLADNYRGQVKFGKLDIDTNERVAREYGVSELPIILFFKKGQVVDHVVGAVSSRVLDERIKALLRTST